MNKYIAKTILGSALLLPLVSSCELDQFPRGSIMEENSWEQVSDATNYYVGLQSALRNVIGGSQVYVSEMQADLFNTTFGSTNLQQEHDWSFTTMQFAGDAKWANNYSLISNANEIINNIDKIQVETDEDQLYLDNIKGAAYFARAYAYSNMVVRYCKDYEPATAAGELGLPLVETVDVNAKPSRSTLEETYQFIMDDIERAHQNLKTTGTVTEPGTDALDALEARMDLYMHRYDEAATKAQSLMAKYPLISDAATFASMWSNDAGSEIIYQPILIAPNELGMGYAGIYISYNTSLRRYNPSFLPTQGLMDMYESSDYRKSTYFVEVNLSANGGARDEGYMFYKYPGNPALRQSETDFYNMTKAFRSAELYLIAAEAELMKDNKDEGAALGYLNTLRQNRGASALSSTGDQLVQDMKDEWVREMVGEGFRLDCLKRWHEGFTRKPAQSFSTAILSTEMNTQNLTISADNQKFVWEIPSNDLQANTNLQRNWTSTTAQ